MFRQDKALSTPTIDLHRATTSSPLSGAEADSTLSSGGASNTIRQGQTQPSNLSRIRVLRGLVWLDDFVPLPQTLRGYLLFVLALTVICGLAVFQVWTSLRITQARAELAALSVQYSLIEQRNAELLWQIGQRTTLEQVHARAVQLNFHPALKRNYIANAEAARRDLGEGAAAQAEFAPVTAASAGATDSPAAAPRISSSAPHTQRLSQAEADATTADESSSWSVTERFSLAEFEHLVPGWQQQASASWQAGWQTVRQWGEPLLEQAGDFILGQLKQP
jgi:hypothetical protein